MERLVGVNDPGGQRLSDGRMHDEAAKRRAPLAGRSRRREHDAAEREVEISGRGHDCAVVATEFEKGATETPGDEWPDLSAHPDGPGGGDQGNTFVLDQTLTADTVGKQNLMDSHRCAHLGDGTREQSVDGESGETRSVCRLPHHGVTGDQREGGVPSRRQQPGS